MRRSHRFYCLVESDTHDVKYVGVTDESLALVLRDHYRTDNSFQTRWVRAVLDRGARIEIHPLEKRDCTPREARALYRDWHRRISAVGNVLIG